VSKKKFDSTAEVKKDLKADGWLLVQKVEEIRHGIKFDMLSAIDVIAYHPDRGWLGVNGCLLSTATKHVVDSQNNKALHEQWLKFGFKFALFIYPDKKDRDEGETGYEVMYYEQFGSSGNPAEFSKLKGEEKNAGTGSADAGAIAGNDVGEARGDGKRGG